MGKLLNGISEELTLYARQTAWLDAPPKPPEKPKGKPHAPPTRRDKYQADGAEEPLPDLDASDYLWAFLSSMGVTEPGAHGPSVLAWGSIDGWQRCNGVRLDAWECRAIRAASAAYVGEYYAAQDPERPAPFASPQTVDRQRVAESVRAVFGARAKRGRQ